MIEVAAVKEALRTVRTQELLTRLLETCALLTGKKGRGKTLSAIAIAWQLRELFGRHVVTVGSKAGLKPSFGPFTYLDEKMFLGELEKLTEVTRVSDNELSAAIDNVLRSMGISVIGSTMLFDEAYKLFDCRTPSDKVVRVFGHFISQQRHYHITTLLLTPHEDMLDKRIRRQVDWHGKCYHNKFTDMCTVRFTGGLESWKLKIDGLNYYHLYDSWVVLGFRRKHLEIGEL